MEYLLSLYTIVFIIMMVTHNSIGVGICILLMILALILYVVVGMLVIHGKLNLTGNRRKRMESLGFFNMDYDSQKYILTLKKRRPENTKRIRITADRDFITSYKPEQYVYTGATVGGITMGGIHKEGGYHYISSTRKTGKYFFSYIDADKKDQLILRIQLDDELYEEALNSEIKEYLNSKKQIVVGEIRPISTVNPALGMETVLLPYDKCLQVKNFICGM